MPTVEVSRTLVKSPPELWEELSGERLKDTIGAEEVKASEDERLLVWETDGAKGTATLEPSGLGTKVTLLRLRSDEQAPTAAANATIAILRNALSLKRCIVGASTHTNRTRATGLLRLRLGLRDAYRDHPGDPEEQEIHRQERRQARARHGALDHQPLQGREFNCLAQ